MFSSKINQFKEQANKFNNLYYPTVNSIGDQISSNLHYLYNITNDINPSSEIYSNNRINAFNKAQLATENVISSKILFLETLKNFQDSYAYYTSVPTSASNKLKNKLSSIGQMYNKSLNEENKYLKEYNKIASNPNTIKFNLFLYIINFVKNFNL